MENTIVRRKTALVILITVITMIAEIAIGIFTESVALTSDGFHMGTHAIALAITYIVCILITKNSYSEKRLNALGGYTSAILLGYTAFGIIYTAFKRIITPENIRFDEAVAVAVTGFIVNILCMFIMKENHHHHHDKNEDHPHRESNINFKAAYIHIVADALTSVLAISALLAGKYWNIVILDHLAGILGAVIILKWAVTLIKDGFSTLVSD